jgi:hypothetical protein
LVLGFLEKQTTPEEDQKLFNEKNYFLCMTMPEAARAFGEAARKEIESELTCLNSQALIIDI